jgi:hypothetical protein
MSVTIHWRPSSEKSESFSGGTRTNLDALKRAFGTTIGPEHAQALRAMAIAARDELYNTVAETVEQVGEIEVWGEY